MTLYVYLDDKLCVCERERERECVMCVRERERDSVSCVRERESVCVCV